MVKIIMGLKGTGKTKTLIEGVNNAVEAANGHVVCIEKGSKLMYDVSHKARLISTEDKNIGNYERFYGFISGLIAGNFDISDIYVDSITKICGRDEDMDHLLKFIQAIEPMTESNKINMIITVSHDEAAVSEDLKKYF